MNRTLNNSNMQYFMYIIEYTKCALFNTSVSYFPYSPYIPNVIILDLCQCKSRFKVVFNPFIFSF